MPSPYVRRRRLAAELRKIRENRGLTTDELAKLVYQSRTKITRLETAQIRPDVGEVMTILEALGVEGTRYDKLVRLARDASTKGWWDRYGTPMGHRQKIYADLESSAETIRSYDQTAMPAVLQSPDFIQALVDLDRCQGPLSYRPERMADARRERQESLLREGGPSYETVLDECIIHRLALPASVKVSQLHHIMSLVARVERIKIRVLPHDAMIPGGFPPRSSFYLFTFPDPADPPIAAIDTVTTDLVLSGTDEVSRYVDMFDRLRKAALPPAHSLTYLKGVADKLMQQAESDHDEARCDLA
ncbi:hypothetical protein Acsp03_61840 [Actinomadura sp. NBRC 104412]|uniref:helix-turn-helix domain-containing protein n=1 Tax=Actinomadura sp. NBRC 104412 TaxID=3032203 RepID=UPI0024A31080|nr:Scr1 family TA system antitoxin-like transcriptional regulator [Actinomadura sp. NBRC 104412]GLZ08718.1 hypothetical protein Acsp03_61840 [Actinomadura sp. NBRC 104412]